MSTTVDIQHIFPTYIAPITQWLVIIAGWIYVSWDNNQREHRKEIRSQVNEIKNLILETRDNSFQYYTSTASDPNAALLELQIKEKLDRIERSIDMLNNQTNAFSNKTTLVKLKDSITGYSQFESVSRQPLPHRDRLHGEISLNSINSILYLEECFNNKYGKKKTN